MEQLLQTGGVHETSVGTEALLGTEEFIGVWVVAGLVRGSQEHRGSEQHITAGVSHHHLGTGEPRADPSRVN